MTHPEYIPLNEDGMPDWGHFMYRDLMSHLPTSAAASVEASDKAWEANSDDVKSAFRQAATALVLCWNRLVLEHEARLKERIDDH